MAGRKRKSRTFCGSWLMSGKQGRPTWRSSGLGGSDGWSNGRAISKLADDGWSKDDSNNGGVAVYH